MIQLTERLQKIADSIQSGESVADIGSDHGYIPVYLYENGISDKIIVTDIRKDPLDIAKNNIYTRIARAGKLDFRMGNGLYVLRYEEVDAVIIAGMGGILIKDILSTDKKKSLSFNKLILQPRNAQDKLRQWLVENGFKIQDEKLAREGKYICEIIIAVPGTDHHYKDIYYEIGYKLIEKKDPLLKTFILRKIEIERKILKDTKNKDSEKAASQYEYSRNRIQKLEEVLKYVHSC